LSAWVEDEFFWWAIHNKKKINENDLRNELIELMMTAMMDAKQHFFFH